MRRWIRQLAAFLHHRLRKSNKRWSRLESMNKICFGQPQRIGWISFLLRKGFGQMICCHRQHLQHQHQQQSEKTKLKRFTQQIVAAPVESVQIVCWLAVDVEASNTAGLIVRKRTGRSTRQSATTLQNKKKIISSAVLSRAFELARRSEMAQTTI